MLSVALILAAADMASAKLCQNGIISPRGTVCCNATCGRCNSPRCSKLEAGAQQCCAKHIINEAPACVHDYDVVCRLTKSGAAYGFSKTDIKYTQCMSSHPYPYRNGRYCCAKPKLAECDAFDADFFRAQNPLCKHGIINKEGTACCNATCGACGVTGCSSLPGGRRQCCTMPIVNSRPECKNEADTNCRMPATKVPLTHGMARHLLSGCCHVMGEVVDAASSWKPSCASTENAPKVALRRRRMPFVIMSVAVASERSQPGVSIYTRLSTWRLWAGSLRRVYSGDVVVFAGPREGFAKVTLDYARSQRINVHLDTRIVSMMTDRFLLYTSVCNHYRWCLAVDFRDTLFQGDPFAQIESVAKGAQLIVFQELSDVTIAAEPYNRMWINHCWGASTLARIGHEQPVCGGAIMATPVGMQSLKDAFCSSLWATVGGRTHVCNDQGMLNVLAYGDASAHGNIPWMVQRRNESMIVEHIGSVSDLARYQHPHLGFVLNSRGSVAAVVHQYDRFNPLKVWGEWLRGSELPYAEWQRQRENLRLAQYWNATRAKRNRAALVSASTTGRPSRKA